MSATLRLQVLKEYTLSKEASGEVHPSPVREALCIPCPLHPVLPIPEEDGRLGPHPGTGWLSSPTQVTESVYALASSVVKWRSK